MTPVPVVLLPAATGPQPDTAAVRAGWRPSGRAMLTPDLTPGPGAVVLEDPGMRVLAAISAAGADRAVLCGSGYGAMVAMHLATHYPARVHALVLTTAHRLPAASRRGVADAVTGLLPVSRVQQLRGSQQRVLELLDQVRVVDHGAFSTRVQAPALVVVGSRDLANFGPSRRLATLLPRAELAVAPGATQGWAARSPGQLAAVAAAFLRRVDEG